MTNESTDSQMKMPEIFSRRQLNALYREIPLKDTTSRLLRKYFNAVANLYGIIPVSKAYEIISQQSPRLVSKDDFFAFVEIARHECEDYYLLGLDELYIDGPATPLPDREIIDVSLISENLDEYHSLMQNQSGKPYYIPKKKELLSYDDPFYCENTPDALALHQFLRSKLYLNELTEESVFSELLFAARCRDVSLQQIVERLNKMGITFDKKDTFSSFIKLHQAFHNNTRMQCNRGYTPTEMFAMQSQDECVPKSLSFGPNIRSALSDGTMDADEMRKSILTMELPSEELRFNLLKEIKDAAGSNAVKKTMKIGRNAPCPCGSGKKYKKCCGR